jgi:hypothetical protein
MVQVESGLGTRESPRLMSSQGCLVTVTRHYSSVAASVIAWQGEAHGEGLTGQQGWPQKRQQGQRQCQG